MNCNNNNKINNYISYWQVRYLKSAMKIAETLNEVDTDNVEPFHNPAQFMSNNQFRKDNATEENGGRDFVKNSNNSNKSGLITAPSIINNNY